MSPSPSPEYIPPDVDVPLDPKGWLAAIIDSSDDAIISKTLEGIITTWNKGAQRIYGYTAEEMIGQSMLTIIPPDHQDEEAHILERLRRGDRVDHFETVRQRKDGSLIDVSVTFSPVRDASGRIVGISKIARDITAWKQLLRDLTAAREAAEAASLAKDHFLSVLSHELRTPLTPALGALSLMEKDETLPESGRELVSMVRRNIETEARLVDDLLDLTRIARGKMHLHFEVVDAAVLIKNVVGMFNEEIANKNLTVRLDLEASNHRVWADPGRFQQVLLNLVSNAIKFTPRDGCITLRSTTAENNLQIEVTDTGFGIEPDVMPRLFSAFEQGEKSVTRRFGGLGLGLSIVKSLMELHDGSVTAFSDGKGRGATFTLRIPIANTPVMPQKPPESAAAAKAQKCRVLLVEDHDDTRQMMRLLLRSFGCHVDAAGTVKEAAELAASKTFDLLISDHALPDGTGIDVIRHVHEQQPVVKAIAVSGFGQDEDLRRSRDAGYLKHLIKPVNLDALRRAVLDAVG